ncbi:hypothetical protein AB4Z40_32815 [Bosea sp. 2YAB26]|uniref:hypothetical protein n=1 Tax=Bosea sp. 2YAB26 TaxID=3237478 RepID=UPI003F8F23DD
MVETEREGPLLPEPLRAELLDGIPGALDRERRGVKSIRGEAAVAKLKAEIESLQLIKMMG